MVFMLYLNLQTVYDHSMEQNSQMNLKLHPSAVRGFKWNKKTP